MRDRNGSKSNKSFIYGFLLVFTLGVVILMANQLKLSKEALNDKEKTAETGAPTEQVAGITHTPPSLDDVPEGPLGEAILRGY